MVLFFAVIGINMHGKFQYMKGWVSWGNMFQNTRSPNLLDLANQIHSSENPYRAMSINMYGHLLNSYGIETIEGAHPLVSKRYFQFWLKLTEPYHNELNWIDTHGPLGGLITSILPGTKSAQGYEKIDSPIKWDLDAFVNVNLLSLVNAKFIISRDKLTGKTIELVLGADRSWSTLTRIEKIKINIKANFSGRRHLYIYRNKFVFPRAYTVENVRIFKSDKMLLSTLGKSDLETLSNTLFINQTDLPAIINSRASRMKRIKIISQIFKGDKVTIKLLPSEYSTVLIVVNTFSPFWQTKIDGVTTDIFPANHAFWGVYVPPGSKLVEFTYKPPYLL